MKKRNYSQDALALHKKYGGKIETVGKVKIKTLDNLSTVYTPGVGAVSMKIFSDKNESAKTYTIKKNTIAVVSDGSAVLGLGNIGPYAAMPVMEGKAAIMKAFAGVDAFPICLNTQDEEEIIQAVKNIEPAFGGINLEDIAAPKCFRIEERLQAELSIPVMHDDQWGAATVIIAAIINSLKVLKKRKENLSIAISGAGAAGIACAAMLKEFGVQNVTMFDSKGAVNRNRNDIKENKGSPKYFLADQNVKNIQGTLPENIHHFNLFIGLSKPRLLTAEMVSKMLPDPIIFALANPDPEILPDEAYKGGAKIVGTGRSDFPNQINNSVFFPGFWRGMLDRAQKNIPQANYYDKQMLIKCAHMIAGSVKPTVKKILPTTLEKKVHKKVAETIVNYKLDSKKV